MKEEIVMSQIVVFGGSFNPIHNGHLKMVQAVHEEYGFEKILIMPNNNTYYKVNSHAIEAKHRVNMIQLAISDVSYLAFSDMELVRGGMTYTIDTIRELKKVYNDVYFIIGGDSLAYIHKWKSAEELMRLTHFLALGRDEIDEEKALSYIRENEKMFPGAKIAYVAMENSPISSSEIRENVIKGISIDDLVPDSVAAYIKEHGLYKGN